jgi:DNA-binding response OmpR family regulator
MRILVLEDRGVDREFLIEELRESGYDVEGSDDVDGFKKLLSIFKPDIVIMDIMLPPNKGEEGIYLWKEIKKDKLIKKNQIIFITLRKDRYIDELLRKTNCHFLYKPFEPSKLLELIEAMRGTIK